MYLCVSGIVIKPVPSQEDERSCICVSEVSLSSLYQARKMRGHVFVLEVSILPLSMIFLLDFETVF
jgi:hypothetical protein